MDRRHFLMNSAVAGTALRASALASPNDTLRVACVGLRGRGKDHIRGYTSQPNVQLVALCDIDESILAERTKLAESLGAKNPKGYVDIRKLLEDKSIDAISIATPNHSHTLQTVWGLQAGKNVYVEKPCAHDMFEAIQISAAQKKYNRIVQHGTQSRSSPAIREAIQKMRDGLIGDLYMARGLCFKWRNTIGHTPVSPVPKGVHYDLWLGPAPEHPFTRNRFHYNWHWFWAYGNGDMGNQGIHQMDLARWGLGVKYPTLVSAVGGHFMFDDDQQTPNDLVATFEFHDGGKKRMLVFEVRHWMSNHEGGLGEGGKRKDSNTIGDIYYGSKGYMVCDGSGYRTYLGREQEPGPSREEPGDNFANFLAAVRSGKQSDLNAPIEEGAISTMLVHLANISYRLGRSIKFDGETMTCPGDEEANKMFHRHYRAPFVVPKLV